MIPIPIDMAFLVGYRRWLMSPTCPELFGFKAPETRLHTSSSKEEWVWLEKGDHMRYFMGIELLKSPHHPGYSNHLSPSPTLSLTQPNLIQRQHRKLLKNENRCYKLKLILESESENWKMYSTWKFAVTVHLVNILLLQPCNVNFA